MRSGIHLFRGSLGFLLIIASFHGNPAFGDTDRCAICGHELSDKSYLLTDKVTEEKKQVCAVCVKLPHDCFLCGLPVKEDYVSFSDGRFLCSRDAKTAVLDESAGSALITKVKENLDRDFSRFLSFPETNVDMGVVDRVD